MAFTAQDVKTLREMTGCGMMDCKKALTETDGDQEKAIEYLREKGLSKAAKKAGRIAAEGMVGSFVYGDTGVVVEVNSETDFVAKNADFQKFVEDIAKTIANNAPADVEELKTLTIDGGSQTVGDALTEKIATIGENMNIRRFETYKGVNQSYVHDPDMSVQKYVDGVPNTLGTEIKIAKFARFEKGEGMEKKQDNFAEEVASMMK